jgi:hypothetical protein
MHSTEAPFPMSTSLLPGTWQIPQKFRERIGETAGRQRIMQEEGHLLVVLHAPPDSEDEDRQGRFFWRDSAGSWMPKGLRHGDHPLQQLLEEYDAAIDKLDEREEAAASADEYFDLLKDLNPLVRSVNNLAATLQKAREAVPDDRKLLVMRDAAYELSRRAELLYTDTRHALDFRIAERAEEQAASSERMAVASHRLNLLVAFFFPIATLASILGVNISTGLEGLSEKMGAQLLVYLLLAGLVMGWILTQFVAVSPAKRTRRSPPRLPSRLPPKIGS